MNGVNGQVDDSVTLSTVSLGTESRVTGAAGGNRTSLLVLTPKYIVVTIVQRPPLRGLGGVTRN